LSELVKQIIICLVLNKVAEEVPETQTAIAGMTGQLQATAQANIIPTTLAAPIVAIAWNFLASIIDPRILAAIAAVVIGLYWYYNHYLEEPLLLEDTGVLTGNQVDDITHDVSTALLQR
jgi:hypothetical protein